MRRCGWVLGLVLAATVGVDTAAGGDDSTVSRSRGRPGGAVILWPRIVPDTNDPALIDLAVSLQNRLAAMATRNISDRRLTVRPRPERVCPTNGCRGVSVGVMLGHQEGGCGAIAMVAEPDIEVGTQLVPWAGDVDLRSRSIPFRQPPENRLSVREFVPCNELLNYLDDAAVESTIAAFSDG